VRPAQCVSLQQERERTKGRRIGWSLLLFCLASVLIGGGAVVSTVPESVEASFLELSQAAFLAGQALAVCAWFSLFAARWANWGGAALLGLGASLWFARDTAYGDEMGVVWMALALYGLFRASRVEARRRRILRSAEAAPAAPLSTAT
jgi:hypothetical protein